ncbi:megakaryocyte and platelet inhibitory receptor G6b [Ctenodactylus gundi]
MALVLRLLPLLLWGAHGDPKASLDGHPGDRVTLSCVGVSQPIRWVWAPSFPACHGLSKGRRPILWASSRGVPTVPPSLPFAGRLHSLGTDIHRLELLLSAGDSGTFICKGQEKESRTLLHVLGDSSDCKSLRPAHGPAYAQVLMPLLGIGLVLGLGALGVVWWSRRRSPPPPLPPLPTFAPLGSAASPRPAEEQPKISGDLDLELNLLYADLDYMALPRPRRLSTVSSAEDPTIYAVVV